MRGMRSRAFAHVTVGETVTRLVADEEPTHLRVTSVDGRLLHCDELTVERDHGLEVDPVLGPRLWGTVQSRLQPESGLPRRRSAFTRPAGLRYGLQIVLLAAYLLLLVGTGVAIGLYHDSLALALGAGVGLLWVAMNLAPPRKLSPPRVSASSSSDGSA